VAYLIATNGAAVLIAVPPETLADFSDRARDLASNAYKAQEINKLSVLVGILSGLMSGALYNRFYRVNLPSYLSFFGGRRFVPIVSGLGGLVLALAFGTCWEWLERGMDALSQSVLHAGALGLFAYGVLNRVLIVTGLHHIINNIAWFLLGDYHGVTGDMKRFVAGDPSAGAFMAGFFPVIMFGLPAACLAMYHTARPEQRKLVGGLLGSIALTSVLTGVTEPIEFTFMFLAPALYAVHAVLTGVAFIIMNALGVKLGFNFSAGVYDYILYYSRATRPLWLLPVGAGYFALYYFLFRFVIVRFDLKTPGRGAEESAPAAAPASTPSGSVLEWIAALGGAANLRSVDACTTRLRLTIATQASVDPRLLERLGARGLVRPAEHALQVVVGTHADQLAGEIRAALQRPRPEVTTAPVAHVPPVTAAPWTGDAAAVLEALGGGANVRAVDVASSRLRIIVGDGARLDRAALARLGLRGVAQPAPGCVHLIVGPDAAAAGAALLRVMP